MIRNYLLTAFRGIRKHLFYSLINITGLAVGIACCILILLFVVDELSFDKHHEKAESIYRVTADINFGGNHFELATAPAAMAKTLMEEFPEVEVAGRFRGRGSFLVRFDDENIKEEEVIFADNEVLAIFTIPFVLGDQETALSNPNTLILSESAAKRHFGDQDPLGKQLILDNDEQYEVTGVYEDIPSNSHFHFDLIISMEGLEEAKQEIWLSNNFQTYVLLTTGADLNEFKAKLQQLVYKYIGPQAEQFLDTTMEEFEASGQWVRFGAQPMTDIHLYSNLTPEFEPNSDIKYVYVFSAIALIILLIACINFMNLSTARSASRAKEVGVRKVMGSYRSQLVNQFLTESIMLSAVAILIAVLIAFLALPYFNELSNKQLHLPFDEIVFWGFLGVTALVVGLLAGTYPAFFLSGFRPASVLKGRLTQGAKSGALRGVLVVLQFCASVFLIVATLVVYRQLDYIQNKKLGWDKQQVILIEDAYALGSNLDAFKESLAVESKVISSTISSFLPVSSARSDTGFWPEGEQPDELNSVSMQYWNVDHDYIPTMGMEIVLGRNFSREYLSDSSAIILNEHAVRLFGFENPIGKKVMTFTDIDEEGNPTMGSYEIVGVVKDFHFESLRENIGALSFRLQPSRSFLAIRTNSDDVQSIIQIVEAQWKEMGPGQPFQYSFLDDRFDQMYAAERRVGNIAISFSGLAIFIACLGLFGLAAFTAEQRTKEIGVRKVLGASVVSIVVLLSREFAKLIVVSLLLAIPVSWYFMNTWLQDFAFRINIGPEVFVFAGLATLLIAWLTMSWQSVKAAIANPVDSLKDE